MIKQPNTTIVLLVLSGYSCVIGQTRSGEVGAHPVVADKVWVNDAASMPVRELTIFKDGHAFVLHEGNMPTDESGNVVLDYLPAPANREF